MASSLPYLKTPSLISLDAVSNTKNATHVIVGMQWGAIATANLSYQNKEQMDGTVIKGELQAKLLCIKVAASGQGNYEKKAEDKNRDFRFQFYADALLTNKYVPTTIEEAVEFVRTLPQAISGANGGLGIPISYELLPLSMLQNYFASCNVIDRIICKVDELTIQNISRIFEDMEKSQRQLYDIMVDFEDENNSKCIPDAQLTEVRKTFNSIADSLSSMRSKAHEKLVEVRTGNANSSKLNDIINEVEQSDCARTKITNFIDSLQTIRHKIKYVHNLQRQQVSYIGKGSLLDHEKSRFAECYIHFCTWLMFEQSYAANQHCFKNLIDEKQNCIFVDLQVRPELAQNEGVPDGDRICHYMNGGYISIDVADYIKQEKMLCVVKSTIPIETITSKPQKRVSLEIKCPCSLNGHVSPRENEWNCQTCLEFIEYGFDDNFYCRCGKVQAKHFKFRCNDSRHGDQFMEFPTASLNNILNSIRPYKEYNILILGETGVGKSTWINAFANYITFEDIEEAKNSPKVYLISSKFLIGDTVIQVGKPGDNEDTKVGISKTQEPRAYVFTAGKNTIRVIDTPGLGDTRGLTQDKENMAKILGFIAPITEIHGVCILLRANIERLTIQFKYCINELLTHLHKDAAKNIVFCFTNSRGSFYQPGDIKPSLEGFLREIKEQRKIEIPFCQSTAYCLDNEAFRFLCALHEGVDFSEDQYRSYANSWKISEKETMRLLTHFLQTTPHSTKDTLDLNAARQLVLVLAQPLAQISTTIENNIQDVLEEQKKITKLDTKSKDLAKDLMTTKTGWKTYDLKHPRIVCNEISCGDLIPVANSTQKQKIYKKICHDHCYLDGITPEQWPNPALQGCSAISKLDLRCIECGCLWSSHLHITYGQELVSEQIEDEDVKASLKANKDKREVIEIAMRKKNQLIKEYKAEQKKIMEICAKFASFLKSSAIKPYNDAIKDYLRMELQNAQGVASRGGDNMVVERLEEQLKTYEKEREILEANMQQGVLQPITPDQISQLHRELIELKHFGKELENLKFRTLEGQKTQISYTENYYDHTIHQRGRHRPTTNSYSTSSQVNNPNMTSDWRGTEISNRVNAHANKNSNSMKKFFKGLFSSGSGKYKNHDEE